MTNHLPLHGFALSQKYGSAPIDEPMLVSPLMRLKEVKVAPIGKARAPLSNPCTIKHLPTRRRCERDARCVKGAPDLEYLVDAESG
jgi:hypothetical protein